MELTDYREVTALLQRHGFRFSKSMGQNFLTAAWVPERIAAESGITSADGALERSLPKPRGASRRSSWMRGCGTFSPKRSADTITSPSSLPTH